MKYGLSTMRWKALTISLGFEGIVFFLGSLGVVYLLELFEETKAYGEFYKQYYLTIVTMLFVVAIAFIQLSRLILYKLKNEIVMVGVKCIVVYQKHFILSKDKKGIINVLSIEDLPSNPLSSEELTEVIEECKKLNGIDLIHYQTPAGHEISIEEYDLVDHKDKGYSILLSILYKFLSEVSKVNLRWRVKHLYVHPGKE